MEANEKPYVSKRHHAIITSMTAGALAGSLAKTTIAPLDRTKINFQVSSTKLYSLRSAIKFLVQSFRNDGAMSLWRGNSATLVRVAPFSAIQFTSHEQWKRVLHVDVQDSNTPIKRYLAGSLAGVTASTFTYPLDVARARMAVSPKCQYHSLRSVFLQIARDEGILRLYRGIVPTVLGSIPYAGTSFFIYETLKLNHKSRTDGSKASPIYSMGYGAMAGVCGQTASYPLDIVRRRMQTERLPESIRRKNVFVILCHIGRTEGVVKGLYKGLSMNWIKGPIAVGISFATYDHLVHFLRYLPFFQDD